MNSRLTSKNWNLKNKRFFLQWPWGEGAHDWSELKWLISLVSRLSMAHLQIHVQKKEKKRLEAWKGTSGHSDRFDRAGVGACTESEGQLKLLLSCIWCRQGITFLQPPPTLRCLQCTDNTWTINSKGTHIKTCAPIHTSSCRIQKFSWMAWAGWSLSKAFSFFLLKSLIMLFDISIGLGGLIPIQDCHTMESSYTLLLDSSLSSVCTNPALQSFRQLGIKWAK